MAQIEHYIESISNMLATKNLDKKAFEEAENYALKNSQLMRGNQAFKKLTDLLTEAATKFGLPSLQSIQEGFGLNSCAC